MCIRVFTFAFAVIAIVLGGVAQAEEYNVNPGMWETTSKVKVTGVPPEMAAMMQKPVQVEKECVKDKSFDFDPAGDAKECTVKTNRISSEKLTWDITCSGGNGNATGRGEVNFNGDTVSGWFEMNMQGPTGPMKIHNSFEGKRVGSC